MVSHKHNTRLVALLGPNLDTNPDALGAALTAAMSKLVDGKVFLAWAQRVANGDTSHFMPGYTQSDWERVDDALHVPAIALALAVHDTEQDDFWTSVLLVVGTLVLAGILCFVWARQLEYQERALQAYVHKVDTLNAALANATRCKQIDLALQECNNEVEEKRDALAYCETDHLKMRVARANDSAMLTFVLQSLANCTYDYIDLREALGACTAASRSHIPLNFKILMADTLEFIMDIIELYVRTLMRIVLMPFEIVMFRR